MVLSRERLDEYSRRLEAGMEGRGNNCMAALLNVEVEDLVTEIRDLRTGIVQLRERIYKGASTLTVNTELGKLLEGRFK